MLNNIEQTRINNLIYLVVKLEYLTKDESEVKEYIKVWFFEPDSTIDNLKRIFEYNNYPESFYEYNNLDSLKKMCEKFILIVKNEIYLMMKADYDKGWITITNENCEEITNKLNEEISIEMDAERITKDILNNFKNGDSNE